MSRIRFEPIGEEITSDPGETVLDAAFRAGYNLAYGCREGQCSACKCFLLEGDAELKPYSNFALSDTERSNGYSLMCRAIPDDDVVVELLHYDPDAYRLDHAIRDGRAVIREVREWTADITGLVLEVLEPADFSFTPGQYVDVWIPGDEDGARRSFSLANAVTGDGPAALELMIKRYPGGRFSGLLAEGSVAVGDELRFTGPYGSMRARPGSSDEPILMVAGGSGMAPILSLLRQFAAEECPRPITFFYGAQTEDDLFALEEIAGLGERLASFSFRPVTGRFVHEAVAEALSGDTGLSGAHVYMCGPPPMLEAAEDVLLGAGFDEQRIFQDKFTTSAAAGDQSSGAVGEAGPDGPLVKKVGDGARAPDPSNESERTFCWFTPVRARASVYEDVTIDTQPSIHRHLTRGWPLHFEDGRGVWDDRSTALRCSDWFAFRDPGEQWERTYYQAGSAYEQQLDAAMSAAVREDLLSDYRPEWVTFLRQVLQLPAFVEHGLWFAMATAARDGLSDSISHCLALQAAMKQRSAQAIVLYAMDLEEPHGDFSIETARASWLGDPEWQPLRDYLERLAATPDWAEVVFAANVLLEPLAGTVLRRELGTRAAASNGDTVTPTLARMATHEWEWVRGWTVALCSLVLEDAEHGAANRAVVDRWVRDWLPRALTATLALVPIAERVPGGLDLERILPGVRRYAARMLADCGIGGYEEILGVPAAGAPGVGDEGTPLVDTGPPGPVSGPTRRVRTGPAARSRVGGAGGPQIGGEVELGAEPERGEDGTYDFVGIVMARSAEGDAVAAVMGRRPGVQVLAQAAFWDVRAQDKLVIPYDEVSEQLGYEVDSYSIQHEMSTHYGRMIATDDALMLFSDPTDAMQYLMA